MVALEGVLGVTSLVTGAAGDEEARKASIQGARSALLNNRKGMQFASDVLSKEIGRNQPFIDAGTTALPLAELAALGEGDFRNTPIFRGRESTGLAALDEAIQGDELSGFAADRFGGTLDASEQGQNRARLNDLLQIGLGSSGTAGRQGATLANLASQSALQGGNLQTTGAQTSFEQRQNSINQALEDLGDLPSLFKATG